MTAKAAPGIIHLVRAETEVGKDHVRPQTAIRKAAGDPDEVLPGRGERCGDVPEPVGGDRECVGINIEADDGAGRAQRRCQQGGVAALADGAIHNNLAGLRIEQAERLGRKHRYMTEVRHGRQDT